MQSLRLGLSSFLAGAGGGVLVFVFLWPVAEREVPVSAPLDVAGPTWDASLGQAPRFVDITEAAEVDFRHHNGITGKFHYPEVMGAGVGFIDYDGDGYLDLYFVQGNYLLESPTAGLTNRLYRNDRDGTFSDVTEDAGVGDAGFGQGCCVGDYDNDGDEDLYVSNFGPNILYRNEGDGTFTDVTARAGVIDPGWGQSSSFLDYDGDGYLDLYVQNYLTYSMGYTFEAFIYIGSKKVLDYPSPKAFQGCPSHLYRNRGDGSFEDVTEASGILRPGGKGMGVACVDFDDDGRVDLLQANDTMENYYFHNIGGGRFEEIGLTVGVAFDGSGIAEASMGVDVGDYDGDLRMDFVVPCVWQQVYTLYRNEGTHFVDVSQKAGLVRPTSPRTGFSPNFLDYDLDGDLDLFFSNGAVRMEEIAGPDAPYEERYGIADLLLANDGRGHYVDVSSHAGPHFLRRLIGRGSAAGDLDNDGDLDLVVSNLGGRAVVLRNDTETGHWIAFRLVAASGSVTPLGASVTCTAGGKTRRAVVHGGVSYLSQNDRRVRFGLGKTEAVERVEIVWPDGKRSVLDSPAIDRLHVVKQGEVLGR